MLKRTDKLIPKSAHEPKFQPTMWPGIPIVKMKRVKTPEEPIPEVGVTPSPK